MDILKKELNMDFDEAIEKVKSALQDGGFGVLSSIDISTLLKQKLQLDEYRKCTTILACNPILADRALDASINMSTLFPCSFVVYEEDGKTMLSHISIMKIGRELGIADKEKMDAVVELTGKKVKAIWENI